MIISNTAANSIFAAKNQNIDVVNKMSDHLDFDSAIALSRLNQKMNKIMNSNKEFKLLTCMHDELFDFINKTNKIEKKLNVIRLLSSEDKEFTKHVQNINIEERNSQIDKLKKQLGVTQLKTQYGHSHYPFHDIVLNAFLQTSTNCNSVKDIIKYEQGKTKSKLFNPILNKQLHNNRKNQKHFAEATEAALKEYEAKK